MTAPPIRTWRRERTLAIAHRGQRATFPEQTLEAYQAAIDMGADGIELDVQMTRDGHLAMIHDLTLDRTTDGHGPVADIDWEDLRRLDAGSWFDPRFAGSRVPSLDEAIELAVATGVLLCVEIKGDRHAALRTAAAVAELVHARDLHETVFISSFDHAALDVVRRVSDGLRLAPERLPQSGPPDPSAAVAQARALGATVMQHRWEPLTTEVVDALHAVGTGVWTWPIDSDEAVQRSVAAGADGLIGDDVSLLLRALGRAASAATTVERH